jgi:hypothetical protein
MSNLQTAVLTGRPLYQSLLDETRFELDVNPVTRDWKQRSLPRLMPQINQLVEAHQHGGLAAMAWGTLRIRKFMPRFGVDPLEVKALSDHLAKAYGGVWNDECTEMMLPLAEIEHYGLASLRVVTTVGVNYMVDAFQGTQTLSNMRYHGIGTGGTAEAVGDTALVTESTTALNPSSTRATGTLTEGATANVFRTVGSNVVNTTVSCTEHGIFNQAATGGGTLLDRSLFASVGLVNGNTLQTTYDFTIAAGG